MNIKAIRNLNLPYPVESLKRELKKHYLSLSREDIKKMLTTIGKENLEDLYNEIPTSIKYSGFLDIDEAKPYERIVETVKKVANKNNCAISFISDALPTYSSHLIVKEILQMRKLTTCYTPYQPEKSQGTLIAHWIYQSVMYHLTGFEAVNSSLYDRSTALYEAILTSIRMQQKEAKKMGIVILDTILPQDKKVIETLNRETHFNLIFLSPQNHSGHFNVDIVRKELEIHRQTHQISAIVFSQVNHLGLLEEVDAITDLAHEIESKAIAIIDPMLLAEGGLKPPADFGKKGADIIVGEGQHLAIAPNFGGPGLGIMGVRHHKKNRNDIRFTAGRYVGDARDISGRPCKVSVISTREQHIRRDKANSNICSNQAFLAVLAGASILAKGNEGLRKSCEKGFRLAKYFVSHLKGIAKLEIAYPEAHFFNEVTLKIRVDKKEFKTLIQKASDQSMWIGVNVRDRILHSTPYQYLKVSFSDIQKQSNVDKLLEFLTENLGNREISSDLDNKNKEKIPQHLLRTTSTDLPNYSTKYLIEYYQKLADKNTSPDEGCYPLGSCTMKYNPYINDYLASLENFQVIHPQAPRCDVQGCLEILYHNQEYFKKITGLPHITTQPVAGAQGELVGLKMFQAYHQSKGEDRDIVLIPQTAHGTNPATATYAGYTLKKRDKDSGIHLIHSTEDGCIDVEELTDLIRRYSHRISGVMITNPNTSGIFENRFQEIAKKIHEVGGLIYMDGANMNAIAGWIDLKSMGVDAVHNNVHKTWSIPHGGGGPGDAFVSVSEKLKDFLPGYLIEKDEEKGIYFLKKANRSIGEFHRHFGNFAHKVRSYAYLLALGRDGIKQMSSVAVLSANYIREKIKNAYEFLPKDKTLTIYHEFIITLSEEDFSMISEKIKLTKPKIIARVGKLFLDFGFHTPTVAFPEPYGLMIEPTESFSLPELDHFIDVLIAIKDLITKHCEILLTSPHFTCIDLVDEVSANRQVKVSESLSSLPTIHPDPLSNEERSRLSIEEMKKKIITISKEKITDRYR